MLAKGSKAPDFSLPADDGSTVSLKSLAGHAVVLGVSPDPVNSHVKFRRKYDLPFSLLADTDHSVAEAYGAWGEKSMYGRKYQGILRSTFVIDGKGRIVKVFEKVKPKGHAAEVLEEVVDLWRAG